jgi:hypothetical protein
VLGRQDQQRQRFVGAPELQVQLTEPTPELRIIADLGIDGAGFIALRSVNGQPRAALFHAAGAD